MYQKPEESELKSADDIVVARPVAPEIKPSEGAIPPPPPVVKSKVHSILLYFDHFSVYSITTYC